MFVDVEFWSNIVKCFVFSEIKKKIIYSYICYIHYISYIIKLSNSIGGFFCATFLSSIGYR